MEERREDAAKKTQQRQNERKREDEGAAKPSLVLALLLVGVAAWLLFCLFLIDIFALVVSYTPAGQREELATKETTRTTTTVMIMMIKTAGRASNVEKNGKSK